MKLCHSKRDHLANFLHFTSASEHSLLCKLGSRA